MKTLNSFTVAEHLMLQHDEIEELKILVKSMVSSLHQDIMDFGLARRTCRRHIFRHAAIMHEPLSLIDSSLWGPSLFPAQLVRDTLEKAAAANQSLRDRLGLSFKRKSQDDASSKSKTSKKKKGSSQQKGSNTSQYRIPKLTQQ